MDLLKNIMLVLGNSLDYIADHFASFLSMEKLIEWNIIIIMTHSEQLLLQDFFHSFNP